MIRLAKLSDCGTYRYVLSRLWYVAGAGPAVFVMLNPSTADHLIDDPTIKRCIAFARAWGYSGFHVVNMFALRATDPREIAKHADPIGPDNDLHIRETVRKGAIVVAAWGAYRAAERVAAVREIIRSEGVTLQALRVTKDGHPGHPLYLPGDLRPTPFLTPAEMELLG